MIQNPEGIYLAMSRKLTITLIFFLFLLPFVSWYYLQSGLNWRKKAQDILSGTQPLPELPFHSLQDRLMERSQLENHVSLLILVSCDSLSTQVEFISKLYKQFKETHKANFLFLDTCSNQVLTLPDTLKESLYTLHCHDTISTCAELFLVWPADKSYALIDKNGIIRAYYPARNHDEKKMLVEHMAILIPRDYSEKVQLKRETQKQ